MTRAEEQIEFIRSLNEALRVQYDAIVSDNTPTRRLSRAQLFGDGRPLEEAEPDHAGVEDQTEDPADEPTPAPIRRP